MSNVLICLINSTTKSKILNKEKQHIIPLEEQEPENVSHFCLKIENQCNYLFLLTNRIIRPNQTLIVGISKQIKHFEAAPWILEIF